MHPRNVSRRTLVAISATLATLATLSLGATACSSSASSPVTTTADFTVRIRNASQLTFTSVLVATGPDDAISVASIAPGQMTDEQAVHAVYTNVGVTVQINGKTAALLPVEGFAGFNPPLQTGRYIITIGVRAESTPSQPELDVSIAKANP